MGERGVSYGIILISPLVCLYSGLYSYGVDHQSFPVRNNVTYQDKITSGRSSPLNCSITSGKASRIGLIIPVKPTKVTQTLQLSYEKKRG